MFLHSTISLTDRLIACDAILPTARLAGFRLMEAGLEQKPPVQSWSWLGPALQVIALVNNSGLLHILQIASKTGAILSGMLAAKPQPSFDSHCYREYQSLEPTTRLLVF